MALANRRPVGFPVTSSSASPSFNPKTLGLTKDYDISLQDEDDDGMDIPTAGSSPSSDMKPLTPEKSLSPMELSPTQPGKSGLSPSPSPKPEQTIAPSSTNRLLSSLATPATTPSSGSVVSDTGSDAGNDAGRSVDNDKLNLKKPKSTSRAPIATGISTTIPVTGERPKPEQHSSLDDDVLYAIFLILYEKDPTGSGMTVKQVCDILLAQHPEMAKLSTKTSNLVSAKLNAYVKRVEKGERSLIYALSRDWADASPKRMVYVYRGILTNDYYLHVKEVMETQKLGEAGSSDSVQGDGSSSLDKPFVGSEDGKLSAITKQRRSTMFDLGVTRSTFLETSLDLKAPQLFVPYSSAPVTASLGAGNSNESKEGDDSDYELDGFDNQDDDEEDDEDDDEDDFRFALRKEAKRSKSMSYLSTAKRPRILTAAAAAPRAPRAPSSPSPSAAAAAAALHAAALQALSPSTNSSSSTSNSAKDIHQSVSKRWLSTVRSGFLTQEIGTPEDISLAELDSLFTC